MSDGTYNEWKKLVETMYRQRCEDQAVSWKDMVGFYRKIDRLMEYNKDGKLAGHGILYRIYNPVVGFEAAIYKMLEWRDTVKTIQGICVDDSGHLFQCPEVVEKEERLLYVHQDTMLLLMTVLVMHEGLYKSAIDLLYDGTGHGEFDEHKTAQRIGHLADNYGIDIRQAMDRDLRNSITHMSFRIALSSGGIVARTTKRRANEALPPARVDVDKGERVEGERGYTRKELLSIYAEAQDSLWTLCFAVMYWFERNRGPKRLFDDAFFRTESGKAAMKRALVEMRKPVNLDIDVWKRIVKDARRELAAPE